MILGGLLAAIGGWVEAGRAVMLYRRIGGRASGGFVWVAVAGGVEHRGHARIAGGVAAGRASAAAVVSGVGGGVARIAPNRDA